MYRPGPVELASCAFGQSSKVSYLQMLTAVCAVVNGGNLMQPYLVQRITAPDGTVTKEIQPTVRRRVISEETSKIMRSMMEGVVTGGTGKNAAIPGYRVGGKSGTSQKLDSENERARIASFVAVAPIDEPKVAVLVCLDEPHSWTTSGGSLSAPVCAEVLKKALPYLGIAPQFSEEEQQKYFADVPDLAGKRVAAAKLELEELGLTASINGEGERVERQYPAAGTPARKGSTIVLDTTGEYDAAGEE